MRTPNWFKQLKTMDYADSEISKTLSRFLEMPENELANIEFKNPLERTCCETVQLKKESDLKFCRRLIRIQSFAKI